MVIRSHSLPALLTAIGLAAALGACNPASEDAPEAPEASETDSAASGEPAAVTRRERQQILDE